MIYAKDYGVVADGITDDTAALQLALNTDNYVILPAGIINLVSWDPSSPIILLNDYQTLVGEGGSTVLKWAGTENRPIIGIVGKHHVTIRDLVIDGNNQQSGHGIRGGDNSHIRIENVEVRDVGGYGIGFEEGTNQFLFLNNLVISNTLSDGIDYKNPDNANYHVSISNIHIVNPGTDTGAISGIDIRGVANLTNISVTGLSTASVGIRFRESGVPSVGEGGHYSTLSSFYIQGASDSIGLSIPASRVAVSAGTVEGTNIAVHVGGTHNMLSSIIVGDALTGFLLDTDSAYSRLTNCDVRGAVTGFELEGDYVGLTNSTAQNNSGSGLVITTNSTGAIIDGNLFRGNGAANIKNGVSTVVGTNSGY